MSAILAPTKKADIPETTQSSPFTSGLATPDCRRTPPPFKRLSHKRDVYLKACRPSCGRKDKRSVHLPNKRIDDLHAEPRLYQRIVISGHTDTCIRDRQGQSCRIAVQIDADGRLAVSTMLEGVGYKFVCDQALGNGLVNRQITLGSFDRQRHFTVT